MWVPLFPLARGSNAEGSDVALDRICGSDGRRGRRALLRPLLREDADALAARDADLAVYRDQLTEIEADRERGLIGASEAESARAEVARRLIEIEERNDAAPRARRCVAMVRRSGQCVRNAIAVLVPLLAIGALS